MDWDKTANKYIVENCLYTLASWEPYEAAYKKYYITLDTKLDPTDDVDATYEEATKALRDAKAGLKIANPVVTAITDFASTGKTSNTGAAGKKK